MPKFMHTLGFLVTGGASLTVLNSGVHSVLAATIGVAAAIQALYHAVTALTAVFKKTATK